LKEKKRKEKIENKWTGLFCLFSVNGLGLNFCGIFEEKANYRSDFGKGKEGKKAVRRCGLGFFFSKK
jgi:hypothetical protein